MKQPTEVSFLRAFVSHYSFVTGLLGKLEGKSGGPEDCSVGVNVILNAEVIEDHKVTDPMVFGIAKEEGKNVLKGRLFQCCDLLSWIAGTFDSQDLRNQVPNLPPTKFTIETWKAKEDNQYEWQLKSYTLFEGVKWLDAAHTTDGGDRACAGMATFTFEKKTVTDIDGDILKVPEAARYPSIELRRVLLEKLDGPKHPASYLG
jgi:hypothetical protein